MEWHCAEGFPRRLSWIAHDDVDVHEGGGRSPRVTWRYPELYVSSGDGGDRLSAGADHRSCAWVTLVERHSNGTKANYGTVHDGRLIRSSE